MKSLIYLDNAATTFPKPEVVYRSLDFANRNYSFNAGRGSYEESNKCSDIIFECKKSLSKIANCKPESITFLSSATHALNNLIYGIKIEKGDNVYLSPFEHNSAVRPLYYSCSVNKCNLQILPFDEKTWNPDLDQINDMFAMYTPKLVLLTHINNVTGYVVPYEQIFKIAKKHGSITILDCAQSFGIYHDDYPYTDFIVFAGHKSLYANFGIAGFINLSNTFELVPIFRGGTGSDSLNFEMPGKYGDRFEAGSPNVVAIYGLYEAIQWLRKSDVYSHELSLTHYLIDELKKIDKVHLYLPSTPNSIFGIVSFNVNGYCPEDVGTILYDEFNICVRTGYHCCPLIHDFLHTKQTLGTVRVSVGAFNNKNDIDTLLRALKSL